MALLIERLDGLGSVKGISEWMNGTEWIEEVFRRKKKGRQETTSAVAVAAAEERPS